MRMRDGGAIVDTLNALVDYFSEHPDRESIAVIAVPESELEGLRADEVLAVRPLARAV